MSSAGHIMDMVRRWNSNREQQKNLWYKLDATFGNEKPKSMMQGHFNAQKYPPVPEEEQEGRREQIISLLHWEEIIRYVKTLLVIGAIGLLVYALISR